jgi:hypothetical protein
MKRFVRTSLVGSLVVGFGGCSGTVGGSPTGEGGSGSGNGGGPGGSGGAAVVMMPAYQKHPSCVQGIPATSQVPRMTDLQYDTVVNDLLGVTTLTTMGNLKPSQLLAADSHGSLTAIGWTGYLTAAQTIAKEVMASATNKARFISCDPAAGTCLADTIEAFGRKAFRRPMTSTEITSFQRLGNLAPASTPAEIASHPWRSHGASTLT